MSTVAAVIVTHNSETVIEQCLIALQNQSIALQAIYLVDSGSRSTTALKSLQKKYQFVLVQEKNIGFSRSNNIGYRKFETATDYVLFVNPDAFLYDDVIEKAITVCSEDSDIGCLTGKLLQYDLEQEKKKERIDSTGIFRKWYGRWGDRGQGMPDVKQYEKMEEIPAACGAFLFCRMQALQELVDTSGFLFDPDFFMYKEDIELSLRMKKLGWKIVYHPELVVYHCRGWQQHRQLVPYESRLLSARNEVLLYKKHPSVYMIWALLKLFLVRFFYV